MIINKKRSAFKMVGIKLMMLSLYVMLFRNNQNPTVVFIVGNKLWTFDLPRNELKRAWDDLTCFVSFLPVYFVSDETDCDHVRVIRPHKFANKREANSYISRSYDNAEGPVYWKRITNPVYNEMRASERMFGIQERDYTLEAFEDGHQHCVIPTLTVRI